MVDTSTLTITGEGGSTDTTSSSGITLNTDDTTIGKTDTVDKDTMTETVAGTETSAEVSANTATPDTGDGGGEDDPNGKNVTPSYSANASRDTSSAFYGVKLNAATLGSISDCPLYKNTTDEYIGLEALGTASPGFYEYVNENFEYDDGKCLVTHRYADEWNVCFENAALYYSGLKADGLIVTKGSRPSFNGRYFEYTLDPEQALTVTVRRQASGLKITKTLFTYDTDRNETTSTSTYVHTDTTFSDGVVPTKIIFEGQAGGGGGQGGKYWLTDSTHNGKGGGGGGYMAAVLDLYDLDDNNPYWKIHIYAGSDPTWTGGGDGHDGGSIVVSRHTDDDESDEGTECFEISGGAGGSDLYSSRPAGGTITSSYGEDMHWWRLRAIDGGDGGLGYQAEDDEKKGESIASTTIYASATSNNCTSNGLARKTITAKAGGSSDLDASEYWSGGGGASCLGRGGDGGYKDADGTWHNDPNDDDAIEPPGTGGGGGGGCGGSGIGGSATKGHEGGSAYIAIYY